MSIDDVIREAMEGFHDDWVAMNEQRERLGALTRSQALERIAGHPPEWRVKDILTSDDYGVLAGPKGVGKTFALLDLAVAVALGKPWFGRFETTACRALVLTAEDSEARLWQRIDAIARARGAEPSELEERILVYPAPFDAIRSVRRLAAELEATEPGLVVVDPAYKYLPGARASSIFDMGAALTPIQVACADAGTALLIGHHYNRQNGKEREERISGAGLLEWARLIVTAEAQPRRDESPDVTVRFEITGNNIDPLTFTVRRTVNAQDDSPNPELTYKAEVLAEGAEARATTYMTAADRVFAALPDRIDQALNIREIGDVVAHDITGKGGLKHDTIYRALTRELDGRVDHDGGRDSQRSTRWWRA